MELSLPHLDFTISINACHDEIMHKMQVLTNMEIQLLRKFQHQVNNSDMHYKMVHDVRVLILNLQQVYKDVKQYFDEMGIKFIYDFFRKIQVLMVCGYNFLSQALLVNVDKIEDKKTKDEKKPNTLQCKVCKCTCSDGLKNKQRQIKEVQHYDYKISMLQNQQQKITSQIQAIYEKIMIQKPMIEKTKPSLAIRELEDMKEHIQNVMQSTNSIFQETYMMKYVQFKNYLTQIKKPEDIVDYFISNMTFNMKEKFLKAMQKAIYKAQHMEQRVQNMHSKDAQVQTDKVKQLSQRQSVYRGFSSLKPQKNSTLLTKQRKHNQKMIAEVQYMRKQINSLISQNNLLKNQVQKKQQERIRFKENYQTLEQLYNKRSYELEITQSENKWLANEKQTEGKKLRLEIKELKKEQVQMVNQQTQILIAPDCISTSTQTQIVHFQNQVDNEIINVLKKSNQKMIQSLNEKQRKIRELISIRDEYILLKDCKVMCLGFLDDLREVTTYKINQLNKDQNKIIEKKKGREPIIPLNENTSNNSVMITINKLTEQVKTLLLGYDLIKKRTNEKRQSNASKNFNSSRNSRNTSRKSSKLSQFSERSAQLFFRNTQTRKSSMVPIKKQTEFTRTNNEPKKSTYLEQYLHKTQKISSNSISGVDILEKQVKNVKVQVKNSSRSLSSQGKRQVNSFSQRMEGNNQRKRNSSFQGKMTIMMINQQQIEQIKRINVCKDQCVQANIFKASQNNNNSSLHKNFSSTNQMSQQTDILCRQLTQFERLYNLQAQQISKLKAQNDSNNKNSTNQQNTSRKNPYIRKPGTRLIIDRMRSPVSQRNYVSVNNSLPMNDTQISESIQQHLKEETKEESVFAKTSPVAHDSSVANIYKPATMTLQSRLQQLINPKNKQSASASNLIVFKKSHQEYRKRTSQITTIEDMKNVDKNLKERQKEFRSTCREQSLLIMTQSQSRWKEMVKKLDQNIQNQKENIKVKTKNQSFVKSKFVERIIEQNSKNQSSHSNESTLIEVSKKSPQQRQRKVSPNFQLTQNTFVRTVRQMLLTSESKQRLVKKIQEICQEIQKQKEVKRMRRTIKTSFTTRDLRSQRTKKQMTQIFKLGQEVQY